jgi:hypothetical protein
VSVTRCRYVRRVGGVGECVEAAKANVLIFERKDKMTFRLLPPTSVAEQVRTVNGRTYSSTPGNVIDVLDADAQELQANGWIPIAPSGLRVSGRRGRWGFTMHCLARLILT